MCIKKRQVGSRQHQVAFFYLTGKTIYFSGQTGIPPIINRKVAAAMIALSVYGLLLIVISNNNININPVYVLTNIRNRYYIYNDASSPVTDGTPKPQR